MSATMTEEETEQASGLVYGQRLTSPLEIQRLLEQLIDEGSLIKLSNPEGASYTTTLWTTHPERDTIALGASKKDPDLERLLASEEVVAEAYLDNIKLQFCMDSMVKVQGDQVAINARYPSELIRFQRRSFFRVRPLKSAAPLATLHHPSIPDMRLNLRIVDISLGGVALALPKDIPMFPAGIRMANCKLQLDSTSHVVADLLIHHITVLNAETEDTRLGCEIQGLNSDDEQTLLGYINHTQKRQHAIRR